MRTPSILLVVALVACVAAPALAQTPREGRPYRGLFAARVAETEQLLTLSLNAGGGYDDDVLLAQGNQTTPTPGERASSTIGSASAALSYSLSKARSAFSAGYSAGVSFYPQLQKAEGAPTYYASQSVNASGAFEITDRTRLSAGAFATFQPFYYLMTFPTMPDPTNPPPSMTDPKIPESAIPADIPALPKSTDPVLRVLSGNYLNTGFNVSLSHAFTRRLSSSAFYNSSRSGAASYGGPFIGQSVGASLNMSLGKGLAAHGGYTYGESQYGTSTIQPRYTMHQIDAGIGYDHALSLTRKTRLSFTTGTSIVSDQINTHFGLTGRVTLTRELGRTWTALAGYSRDVSFQQVFAAPVISDTFNAGVGGMLNRRLQFQASFGTALGKVGFGSGDTGFNNYYSAAGLRYGATHSLGLILAYAYSWYHYGTNVILPPGVPSQVGRNTVYGGVTYWVPVFERVRSSHASR